MSRKNATIGIFCIQIHNFPIEIKSKEISKKKQKKKKKEKRKHGKIIYGFELAEFPLNSFTCGFDVRQQF